MHLYGCKLWDLQQNHINNFKIAWRKIITLHLEFPPRAHNPLVNNIWDVKSKF